ncbi:asparagine--tRNA ligase, cytoplasmic 2-like [Juglans microcarpa x Juglans regia]|uniref:asparagine--tRNA ligase, cytoplasmic 2-like n=1 Tax=Juglans microcarpa x Juglans regia TaxID=2249226 RepID=UPI001B7F711C|nr:asparagine--tRNA ligase, cytoplasmic 2-like [Juglans microcarpa x Juglans regia]
MTTEQPGNPMPVGATRSKYSNRVVLKTILERSDGGLELIGVRVVIGGWVKASKEVPKESLPPPPPPSTPQLTTDDGIGETEPKDSSCMEILQSRIPFFRSIMKGLGCHGNYKLRENSKPLITIPFPPLPPQLPSSSSSSSSLIAFLQVSDGSCVASLQVVVDSSIVPLSQLLHIGTSILVEGLLGQPSVEGKHVIELKAEKILYIGTVEHDKYPLSMKRLPFERLRDYSQFRPRTTTVASVTRISNALTLATHIFFQQEGFLHMHAPVITTTDCEGFTEKFQVTTLLGKVDKTEKPNTVMETEGVSLEVIKSAAKEKTMLVEELQRSGSNKEALAAALIDLRKTNELASQFEAREKSKPETSLKAVKLNFSEDFFSCQTYLTVSGRLHLESYACALGNVYSVGPRFRADCAGNVAERSVIEIEMAFSQLEDAMSCADDFFKFLCKWVLDNCPKDMKLVSKRIDKTCIDRLQSLISGKVEKISYAEAVDVLGKVEDKKFEIELKWGSALTAEHLSYLVEVIHKKPVMIYNYPKEVKPFYARLNDDGKTVAAFDLVVPKARTLISGSQNEERLDMLSSRIKELGLPREQYEWYLDLRRHGTVEHSGFSLGLDQMILFTTGLSDARDVIPFPRSYAQADN